MAGQAEWNPGPPTTDPPSHPPTHQAISSSQPFAVSWTADRRRMQTGNPWSNQLPGCASNMRMRMRIEYAKRHYHLTRGEEWVISKLQDLLDSPNIAYVYRFLLSILPLGPMRRKRFPRGAAKVPLKYDEQLICVRSISRVGIVTSRIWVIITG